MSRITETSSFLHEGLCLRYLVDTTDQVAGLQLVPEEKRAEMVDRRDKVRLPIGWNVDAWRLQPLVGIHLAEDTAANAFTGGRTLQGSPTARSLAWEGQCLREDAGRREIVTRLRSTRFALEAEHLADLPAGVPAIRCRTRVTNTGHAPLTLLLLTSFSLGGLTPFAADEAAERLHLHRFRSSWSQEGRHVAESFEHLHLEPSWTRWNLVSERFGQVGSMPTRGFFSTAAIEDRAAGVFWAAQVAWHGSWQIEALRWGESAGLAGGLADWEFGHWRKILAPGESFETPAAFLTTGARGLEPVCEQLIAAQRHYAPPSPPVEQDLPIVFNEFCTTWGKPSEQTMTAVAGRLRDSDVKYLVVDAGWSTRPPAGQNEQAGNGDWEIDRASFPNGFGELNAAIRRQGQIPGIWFEFEVCTEGARIFSAVEHQLTFDGRVIQAGVRRFWDFRDPWVIDYLSRAVIDFLRREGFGYLKVDYNDTIGVGCDDAQGLGEGLRRHLAGVHDFFGKIRRELPDLVIENCASGGHRLEPLMVGVTAMSSFSDAHLTCEIPWIAANLQLLIPPEKSQIWAVPHAADDDRQLCYTLSATFLGRMCLSGEILDLAPAQWQQVARAMALYRAVWPILREGSSRRFGRWEQSIRRLRDYQAVRRIAADGTRALVVWHTFEASGPQTFTLPLPPGDWRLEDRLHDSCKARVEAESLTLFDVAPFSGGVELLARG